MQQRVKIDLVAGARPNFMKIAPLYHILSKETWCDLRLIHTGQHFDKFMSDDFFLDLNLPQPDVFLSAGGGTHAEQTAAVLIGYEKALLASRPDLTLVVGDVNSSLAAALAAKKLGIPVAHLEAGLRSFDRSMPEEINRVLTDQIADILWTPSPDGDENLIKEGIPQERIERVGNIMMDALEMIRDSIKKENIPDELSSWLVGRPYVLATLHRPSNVDHPETLLKIFEALTTLSKKIPILLPLHPRTKAALDKLGSEKHLVSPDLKILPALGYRAFMRLLVGSKLVVTDSGGIQEETSYLGIPCLTLRENTERPITVTSGTNRLVRPENLVAESLKSLAAHPETGSATPPFIPLWDGKTAQRVRDSLAARYGK